MALLTKSKYISGLSCHKKMWREHVKDVPEFDDMTIHRFNQGFDFETYARKLFPKAIYLGELGFLDNIERTKKEISEKNIILEAGIKFENYYARCDVLEPNEDGWNLYEFKSSNGVKKYHVDDLAFQKFVLESLGIKIYRCFVIHCNPDYYREGEVNLSELIAKSDVTAEVNSKKQVSEKAEELALILNKMNEPRYELTSSCKNPNPCRLLNECWSILPNYNIFQLSHGGRNWKFYRNGFVDLKVLNEDKLEEILDGKKLNEKDVVILQSMKTDKPIINKEELRSFVNEVKYPLSFLDFETIDTAIPMYDRSKPWQKIPFQYSIDVEEKPNSLLYHSEFFPDDSGDPRPLFLKKLKKDIPGTGSIIVYNMAFEKGRLLELGRDFPEYNEWVNNVIDRMIDLAVPFMKKYYYHKDLKGRYSIKKILPQLTDKNYDDLDIQDGGSASVLFYNTFLKNGDGDKTKLKQELIDYCNLDTEAMIDVFYELKKLVY